MNDALLVLNPRQIPDCIQHIQALDIPTCWISNMNETAAAQAINTTIAATDYDRYIILSDDTLPTPEALHLVRTQTPTLPVITGYCNLDENENAGIVNLCQNPLPPPPSRASSYQFLTRQQVDSQRGPVMPTTFAGLSLTLATRPVLTQHPLQVDPTTGGQMDYDLSYRLARAGLPLLAAVGAYVHHVKERWSRMDRNPDKRLLIGEHPPAITWTNVPTTA